jgi:hypothetical protein
MANLQHTQPTHAVVCCSYANQACYAQSFYMLHATDGIPTTQQHTTSLCVQCSKFAQHNKLCCVLCSKFLHATRNKTALPQHTTHTQWPTKLVMLKVCATHNSIATTQHNGIAKLGQTLSMFKTCLLRKTWQALSYSKTIAKF